MALTSLALTAATNRFSSALMLASSLDAARTLVCDADLFNLGVSGESDKAFELYRWFLPLLRMDTVPNFVQLIKLVQVEVGIGNARVRPPRLQLAGKELEHARGIIAEALRSRPQSVSSLALSGGK